ncbi:hypothetical protein D3C85_1824880 [compost metagenome]
MVGELAAAQHAVDVLADDVDHAVADAQVELDLGIARMEIGQGRHQDQPRQRAGHIDAQPAAR